MNVELLFLVAVLILGFGAVSRLAERSPITPPMVAVTTGAGLAALGGLGLSVEPWLIHGLAEITLVVVLFTDASRIDLKALRRDDGLPLRLLGIGLPLTLVLGACSALMLLPALGLWQAVLLSAVLMPTDAALGQAVVSNPLVPVRIRQTLNVESGLNDGLALPVVLILASLVGATEDHRTPVDWVVFAATAVTLGPLVGWLVGNFGGRLIDSATRHQWITRPFEQLSALGLAALAFAFAELIGGNGFIAAFVAGLTLGNRWQTICECLHEFGEAEGQLLTLFVFLAFGGVMVPAALDYLSWQTALYALASLTIVRMAPVALALLGSGLHWKSFVFVGWFGPRGLASILFALLIVEEERLEDAPFILSVVVLTVLASTFLHGLTAYPLAKRYGRFATRLARDREAAEHAEAIEMPVRIPHRRSQQ